MPPAGRLSRHPILFCKSGLTAGRIAYPMRSASRNSDAISTSLLAAVDPQTKPYRALRCRSSSINPGARLLSVGIKRNR